MTIITPVRRTKDANFISVQPPDFKQGATVYLVRWVQTRDGWSYDEAVGAYCGRTAKVLILDIAGFRTTFDRSSWQVCRA